MREVFDLHKFCNVLNQKIKGHGLDFQSEIGQLLAETVREVPLEDRYYGEDDIDWYYKVNLALINKFKEQLRAEYGTTLLDSFNMFQTLYEEQNKLMPLKWYEYGFGVKEND